MYSHNYDINEFLLIESNRHCIDCNALNPRWVSINNAVFICNKCANIHKTLNPEISTLKSIEVDDFTQDEISLLKIGGNDRFYTLMIEYELTEIENPEFKYHLKICEYYRMLLQCELQKNYNPEAYEQAIKIKPSPEIGLQLMDNINEENINFNQSKLKMGINNVLNTFGSVFTFVGSKIQGTAQQLGIDEKLRNFGTAVKDGYKNFNDNHPGIKAAQDKAVEFASNAGNFVVEKSKEIYNSETVQNMTHKAEEQYIALKEKAKNMITSSNIISNS